MTELGAVDEEPAPATSSSSSPAAIARLFYAALAVAELLYVVDVLTDGAIRRLVEPRARRLRRQLADAIRRERAWQRDAPWVIFEAIELTRDAARREPA